MSTRSRQLHAQFGLHASATDITSVPTLGFLDLESASWQMPEKEKLARDTQRANGALTSALVGALESGDLDFSTEMVLSGVNGNTGAAFAATALDCAGVLEACLGAAPTVPSGAAVTVSAGGGGLSTLTVSGTTVATGTGVLVALTDGTFAARQVISGGGTTTLTLDRAIAGTVTTGATLIRSAAWTIDNSVHEHKHGYWRFEESAHMRVDFVGCAGKSSISVDARGYARLKTDWRSNNASPFGSLLAPTYSAPTKGRAVVGFNGRLMLGADAFLFRDVAIEFGADVVERVSHSGPQGRHGFTHQQKIVRASFKFFGGINAFGELDPTSGTAADDIGANNDSAGAGVTTRDVSIQLGQSAQGALLLYVPAAQFTKRKQISIEIGRAHV